VAAQIADSGIRPDLGCAEGGSAHIGGIRIHKNASKPLGSPVITKTFILAKEIRAIRTKKLRQNKFFRDQRLPAALPAGSSARRTPPASARRHRSTARHGSPPRATHGGFPPAAVAREHRICAYQRQDAASERNAPNGGSRTLLDHGFVT